MIVLGTLHRQGIASRRKSWIAAAQPAKILIVRAAFGGPYLTPHGRSTASKDQLTDESTHVASNINSVVLVKVLQRGAGVRDFRMAVAVRMCCAFGPLKLTSYARRLTCRGSPSSSISIVTAVLIAASENGELCRSSPLISAASKVRSSSSDADADSPRNRIINVVGVTSLEVFPCDEAMLWRKQDAKLTLSFNKVDSRFHVDA